MQIKYDFWKNWKNPIFLFIFYLSAHFLLLFSRVIMWDGWLWADLLKQKDYETLHQLFSQTSLLHIYAVYRAIDAVGNPMAISNILVFISWLSAGLCVYSILKDFARLGEKNSFFAAALFLLVPIFIVRFEISMITYSLSNAAFFIGAYLFLRSGSAVRPASRIILSFLAAIFFISAFFTASFLVFYGALILFAFFLFLKKEFPTLEMKPRILAGSALAFLKKNIFWLLLPVAFYAAYKNIIGSPYGMYEGYNSFIFSYSGITVSGFLSIVSDRIFQFIVYGFFGPVMFALSILQRKIFFAVFSIFFISIFFFERKFKVLSDFGEDEAAPKNIFIWGAVLSVFASAAYILVGESPNPYGSGFDMRHGLILPLGFALIILSFINGLLNPKIRKIAKISVLAIFITYNIYNYYSLDMDWYKQAGIIGSIREKSAAAEIGEKDIFVFYDRLPMYKWRGRSIKDHEYTAYLYEATGNSKLMGTSVGGDLGYVSTVKKDKLDFGDPATSGRLKNIVITSNVSPEPTVKNWLRLKIADWLGGKEELAAALKELVGINALVSASTPEEPSWLEGSPLIYR